MSNCVGSSGAAQHVDGGAEAHGGRGIGTAERFFEGVKRLDVELSVAVGGGGGEDGAEAFILSAERRVFLLEPNIDGGAVDRRFSRGVGDGGSGEEMVEDFELGRGEEDVVKSHGDSHSGERRFERGRMDCCMWMRGLEKIYFAR